MKVSNLNIPVHEKNKPTVVPTFHDVQTNPNTKRKISAGFPCRDPFIMLYDNRYYLYQGAGENGLICSVSDDLESWSDPVTVFTVPENFHGTKCLFWAPECHYYKGHFYIFTSVWSKIYEHRVISVYRADNPLGPFVDIAGGCITPKDWDTIDGTLYVDADGQPWMIFVHEWTCMPNDNGGMCAAKLSEDFTHFISEPIHLFYAKTPAWATRGITDGCYLYTTDAGELLMIWSNFCENGYAVGLVKSESGKIEGPWVHCENTVYQKGQKPQFPEDGGHAMIFKTHEGKTKMVLHSPNKSLPNGNYEHIVMYDVVEKNGLIEIE